MKHNIPCPFTGLKATHHGPERHPSTDTTRYFINLPEWRVVYSILEEDFDIITKIVGSDGFDFIKDAPVNTVLRDTLEITHRY